MIHDGKPLLRGCHSGPVGSGGSVWSGGLVPVGLVPVGPVLVGLVPVGLVPVGLVPVGPVLVCASHPSLHILPKTLLDSHSNIQKRFKK